MSIKTISCKLILESLIEEALLQTREEFANACNYTLQVALKHKVKNAVVLHHLVYYTIRKKFNLGANLAVRVIRRVAASRSGKRRKPKVYKPGSVEYDARIFTYKEKDETISLNTIRGRKQISLNLGDYQREALKGKKPTSAMLIKRGKDWYFNICVEEAEVSSQGEETIGVDLGIRNTVYTTTNFQSPGGERQNFKQKRAQVRSSLQSKGTRGAKRTLKRLSGYEKRRIRHENHILSKQLVDEAKRHNAGLIRLEQLKGIRNRTKVWNRHLNRMIAGWSFYQLQQFITYKAKAAGISVELVDPAYTSQTCSKCLQLGAREGDVFKCTTCGKAHADYNAAWMIATGGAVVNRPELTVCS